MKVTVITPGVPLVSFSSVGTSLAVSVVASISVPNTFTSRPSRNSLLASNLATWPYSSTILSSSAVSLAAFLASVLANLASVSLAVSIAACT